MGQALYRKYRSRSFAEVIGQEPVTQTLQKAIKSGRISHAYLLTGPKGTGKTSVARIIAHEVNSFPYKDESFHLDIIEVDAASNRRIDEIRDIREKVHIAPTRGKYKVYIIDEVHMLTKEAFNALLKTLEEPPSHCIFILATTEPYKLPATIISRTQRFNFRPLQNDKVIPHLSNIAKKEKIDIEPAALELLAEHGEGSLRDSISLLDQLSAHSGKITVDKAQQLLGLPKSTEIAKLISTVESGNTKVSFDLLTQLKMSGISAPQITLELSKQLRNLLLRTDKQSHSWQVNLLKNLSNVAAASQPFDQLEILVLESALDNNPRPSNETLRPAFSEPLIEEKAVDEPLEPTQPAIKAKTGKFSLSLWPEVLSRIKQRAASVYTALRLAEPTLDGNVLTLQFQFPLHKNKLGQSRHIDLIGQVIQELSGTPIQIKSVLVSKKVRKVAVANQTAKPKLKDPDELSNISNIFGSAEMLES